MTAKVETVAKPKRTTKAKSGTVVPAATLKEQTEGPIVSAQPVVTAVEVKPAEERRPLTVKEPLTPHTYVVVRNGFGGKLVYKSSRTGERFVWERFGDERDMELQELKSAKSASRAFFENGWFMIDDPEVISYLGLNRALDKLLSFDQIADLFAQTPDEIERTVSKLTKGQKDTVAFRARQMIRDGEIDSMRIVAALEKSLGFDLIER